LAASILLACFAINLSGTLEPAESSRPATRSGSVGRRSTTLRCSAVQSAREVLNPWRLSLVRTRIPLYVQSYSGAQRHFVQTKSLTAPSRIMHQVHLIGTKSNTPLRRRSCGRC
jgi:hypothetical protein